MTEESAAHTLAAVITKLKSRNIRITPQREVILNYLITHHNHPDVETIYQGIADQLPNLSVATVYNTLKLFIDNDIVIELPSTDKDGSLHYDFFGVPHFHSICENCGKITDVFADEYASISKQVTQLTNQQTGYLVTSSHLEVYGLCPECQQKLNSENLATTN
ncbi:Fur family ferric uptake regulator [Lentilactobacillus senioris DSM 24302 = JCM 17472]|uniref:Fur family ferric uptake regulator n=1 Tax=Lentilactobacillus senioris DSM 24302 = JCM 17472 TaxID=1423802 RepID=A0A0R2CZ02_9LACO|nr:Fur family transcriptional regulator [Lentilactobacillus senioris]KRM93257.1 Fur family ferric uptake regulator [Lentilactobacillus senioris DSM 24302 = JCM 17472]